MMSKEELERLIEEEKEDIDKVKGYWREIIPEQIPNAYSLFSMKYRSIGIYNLLLGNKQEALKWFGEAVEYYNKKKTLELKTNPSWTNPIYDDIVFYSILSRNKESIKANAEEICKLQETMKKKDQFYYYVFTLSNLVAGHDGKAKEMLDHLDKYKTLSGQIYPINDAVKGILQKDPELIKNGVNKMLKSQVALVRSKTLPYEEDFVCIPVVCLLLLAKDHGINIDITEIESKYIPEVLFGE